MAELVKGVAASAGVVPLGVLFGLIVEDLPGRSADTGVIAEGFRRS
ncbi:hypothetical protein ACQPZP_25260 [Spirillospora sp. CA-142024]